MNIGGIFKETIYRLFNVAFGKHVSLVKTSPGLGRTPLTMLLLYVSLHSCITCNRNFRTTSGCKT